MVSPRLQRLLPLLLLLVLGCKSPICRVGLQNGPKELRRWARIEDQKLGWFQTSQRYEDYRHHRIYIHPPDLELLCAEGCEGFRSEIESALQTHLLRTLKVQPDFQFVDNPNEAEFEIFITIAQVREHHPIEYLNYFPPTNHYTYWFKVSHVATGRTAFWMAGMDLFREYSHRQTYTHLLEVFSDFSRNRD